MTAKRPKSGGDPTGVARCSACGNVYPAQELGSGHCRPIGTDGSCACGNEEFDFVD